MTYDEFKQHVLSRFDENELSSLDFQNDYRDIDNLIHFYFDADLIEFPKQTFFSSIDEMNDSSIDECIDELYQYMND